MRHLQKLPSRQNLHVHIDLPVEAFLPRYVPDMRLKIDIYRRLSRTSQQSDLNDMRAELVDRFGEIPEPAERLFELAELRILAAAWKIDTIQREDKYAVLCYQHRPRIEELVKLSNGKLRIVDERSAYLPLDHETVASVAILGPLKTLLQLGTG